MIIPPGTNDSGIFDSASVDAVSAINHRSTLFAAVLRFNSYKELSDKKAMENSRAGIPADDLYYAGVAHYKTQSSTIRTLKARYSKAERAAFWEAIKSMAFAIEHVIARKYGFTPIYRRKLSPSNRRYEFIKALALFGLKTAFDVQKRTGIVFKNPDIRRGIKEAMDRDDLDFFKSVGRVLSREQTTIAEMDNNELDAAGGLERYLIGYWVVEEGGEEPLCFLTMKALADRCHRHGINWTVDEKAIDTKRRRLGLMRVKSFKYRGPGLPRVPGWDR